MKVFIDADGCPVVNAAVSISKSRAIECVIVCDSAHCFNIDGIKTVVVDKGADSSDFKLVSLIGNGDIAITQDYGLAAMCLARGAYCINQNGRRYDDKNISQLLDMRFISKKARMAGKRLKGPKKRTHADDEIFAREFSLLIDEAVRKEAGL